MSLIILQPSLTTWLIYQRAIWVELLPEVHVMSYIRSRYKQEYYTNIKNCSGDIASGLSYERKEIQMHHPRGQKVDPTVTLDSINKLIQFPRWVVCR